MTKVKTKVLEVKVSQLKPNPKNPRVIKDHRFKKLVDSIKDFTEMLDIREIVVDEEFMILGGNMRYKACLEAGVKKLKVMQVSGLTAEQKDEFIIKDNANYGVWDWDMLANQWDVDLLNDWGLHVWRPQIDVPSDDEDYDEDNDEVEEVDDYLVDPLKRKQLVQIEFEDEDYDEAFRLYQSLRKADVEIGSIFVNRLKEAICK